MLLFFFSFLVSLFVSVRDLAVVEPKSVRENPAVLILQVPSSAVAVPIVILVLSVATYVPVPAWPALNVATSPSVAAFVHEVSGAPPLEPTARVVQTALDVFHAK